MRKMFVKVGAKKYLMNTCGNNRTLHMNESNCHCVQSLYEYEEFDSFEEADKTFKGNFRKCKNCFRD